MQKTERRLGVVFGHINVKQSLCVANATEPSQPTLTISPTTCLVDEQISITVRGLVADQFITIAANVESGRNKFESRAVFRANREGTVDNRHDPSLAGTFTGVDSMGLFWSLRPSPGQDPWLRLIKKDVTTPLVFTIRVYDGFHTDHGEINQTPLTSSVVKRLYKHPSVRRIPVTEGPYRGTIFIPEGKGPFPALVDVYGALVSLVETRAALLASHGYAVLALAYMYLPGLPAHAQDADPNHIKAALEWFSQQDYVDQDRMGAVGLCYGGFQVLTCAAICSKVKAVVDINGTPFVPSDIAPCIKKDRVTKGFMPYRTVEGYLYLAEEGMVIMECAHTDNPFYIPVRLYIKRFVPDRPKADRLFVTEEGMVVMESADTDNPAFVPAWQHGAKILTIVGENDKQVNPKWHAYFRDHCPAQYKANLEQARYPGAGHLIEPPYNPLCRVMNPGRARMKTVGVRDEFGDHKMLAGGFPVQHAYAQEDSWRRILEFLHRTLK